MRKPKSHALILSLIQCMFGSLFTGSLGNEYQNKSKLKEWAVQHALACPYNSCLEQWKAKDLKNVPGISVNKYYGGFTLTQK